MTASDGPSKRPPYTGPRGRRTDGVDPVLRSRARKRALQAVYAWQLSGGTMARMIEQFAHEQAKETADLAYFEDLLLGIERCLDELDSKLLPFLDRSIDQVDPIERGVLRLAAYELHRRSERRCSRRCQRRA